MQLFMSFQHPKVRPILLSFMHSLLYHRYYICWAIVLTITLIMRKLEAKYIGISPSAIFSVTS
jgi:hypothetical protein